MGLEGRNRKMYIKELHGVNINYLISPESIYHVKTKIWTIPTLVIMQFCRMFLLFCTCRYKQHKTDFKKIPDARPILLPCKVSDCKCVSYHYVPLMSGRPIRCTCKHTADEHSEKPPYYCNKSKLGLGGR